MNLGEAMTYVLKHRGSSLIQEFFKDDMKSILADILSESKNFLSMSKRGLQNVSIKDFLAKIPEAGSEILEITKVMPTRMKKGFSAFHQDILSEIENLHDPKDKAIFCIKVLGVLTSSTLTTVYNLQGQRKELVLGRLRLKNAFAQFLVTEFILRTLRLFIKRFLGEMEKELTSVADLDQVRYFKRLLDSTAPLADGPVTSEDDPAFRVVDRLRRAILIGDDEP